MAARRRRFVAVSRPSRRLRQSLVLVLVAPAVCRPSQRLTLLVRPLPSEGVAFCLLGKPPPSPSPCHGFVRRRPLKGARRVWREPLVPVAPLLGAVLSPFARRHAGPRPLDSPASDRRKRPPFIRVGLRVSPASRLGRRPFPSSAPLVAKARASVAICSRRRVLGPKVRPAPRLLGLPTVRLSRPRLVK